MTLTSAEMRIEWAAYECTTLDWATITLLNRAPVKVIDWCIPAWVELEAALVDGGYGAASIVGSYVCRDIAETSTRSLHSYRLAIDIDPSENSRQGQGAVMDWTRCRLTREQCDAVESIRTRSGAQVFYAGWRFKNPDPMHFQLACTQADIRSGIIPYEGDTMSFPAYVAGWVEGLAEDAAGTEDRFRRLFNERPGSQPQTDYWMGKLPYPYDAEWPGFYARRELEFWAKTSEGE